MGVARTDPDLNRVGVCALRIWHYGDGVAMRLQMRGDATVPTSERVIHTADIDVAVSTIRDFLRAFQSQTLQSSAPWSTDETGDKSMHSVPGEDQR